MTRWRRHPLNSFRKKQKQIILGAAIPKVLWPFHSVNVLINTKLIEPSYENPGSLVSRNG